MSERNFSVDDILAEVSANRGMTYEKRANLNRQQSDSLVDDILLEKTLGNSGFTSVSEPLFEKESLAQNTPKEPEKKSRKKDLEETQDPLADITPWHERHGEQTPAMTGAQESKDFLSSLKNEQTQVVEPTSHLLYKSAGVHPKVETAPAPSVGEFREIQKEELQQQVNTVAQKMESVYEPTRHVDHTKVAIPTGFGDAPTTAVTLNKKIKADELTGQVKLSGFDTTEQPAIFEDAESWEGEFLSNREQKINDFHMDSAKGEETNGPKTFEDDGEYHSMADASEVKFDLLARRRNATVRLVLTFACFVLTVLFTLLEVWDISGGLFSSNTAVAMGCYVGCLLFSVVLNFRLLWGGFTALFRGGDGDTPAALGILFALLQAGGLALLVGGSETTRDFSCLIGCAAQLGIVMNLWGKRLLFTRMYRNFELVGNSRVKKVVASVENREEAFELGRGLAVGFPQVAYSQKGETLENFMYHSYAPDMAENAARWPLYLLPLFGVIGGLLGYFLLPNSQGASQTAYHIINGALGCMQIALPVSVLLTGNMPFHWFGKRLRSQKIMLSSYDAIEEFKDTDVLALDASDLFPSGSITLKSIKSASNQSLDRSIMDVAGVLYLAESPLKPLFENIIQGKTNLIPEVDTLVYEEEMGISGWVMGYRVLVGTKKLMENHGVVVPDTNYEEKYNEFGLKTVYLSTQGILSAIFLVKYTPNPKVMAGLQRAVKSGLSLHIYSCDPNVTRELICKMFRLPSASVRVMGSVPRRLYKQQMEKNKPTEAILSYEGNVGTFCRSVCAAKKLYRVIRLGTILQTLFVVLGVVAFCAGLFITHTAGFPGMVLAMYQGAAAILTLLLPRLMGR